MSAVLARATARRIALDGLAVAGRVTGATDRSLARPRVHFAYLHAVPDLGAFRRLVASVQRTHDLVGYSEAVGLVESGQPLVRPALCFSFDDAFASNLEAARIVARAGASTCLFVPTGFVGTGSVAEAREYFGMSAGVDEPALGWDDLETLLEEGHEIGNHTVTHRVLSSLAPDEFAEEIGAAREELLSRLGRCDHFAWPRGRFQHMTAEAVRTVTGTGHASCASAERGSHLPEVGSGRRCLRRDHLMVEWPLRHNRWFLASSARAAGGGAWPASWDIG